MSTPHNKANVGEIAKLVLMPGDPLRAKKVAETFLTDAVQFNDVRGMNGYTGYYKGNRVSVMGSGMGMPSIGIYSYELFAFYGVEAIIRIGSAGAYDPDLKLFDLVLGSGAYSESSFARIFDGTEDKVILPDATLNEQLRESAKELGYKLEEGVIHSSDQFYYGNDEYSKRAATLATEVYKARVCEMESFALFTNAKNLGKRAACLVTVSDSIVNHEATTAEERQNSFTRMMEVALGAAKNYQ